jgi:hypothetical protein
LASVVISGVALIAAQAQPGGRAPPVAAPVTSSPRTSAPDRFENVYALQALLDFDTLEAADYDPVKKTLALFGRRTQGDRIVRVLYLDLLATALEADGPTLTLTWTPESRRELELARSNSSFFNIYQAGSRRINALGAWLFGEGGVSVAAGTEIDSVGEQVEKKGGLTRIFADKGPIHVPQHLVPLAFKAVPNARPVVKGMPPRSLMANIALDADIQSKLIGEMPELKARISGYVPFSEWERTRGDVGGEQHTWISAGKFEVQESPDGRSLRFQRTPMQFNIAKYVAGKSTPDPILTGYAQLLTSRYDALAEQFPVLHELRECAKIMAVAGWLKRHGWTMSFPKEGRTDFPMPPEIAGIVHMIVNVRATSSSGLSIKSVMWQTGGIDLRLEPFVWPKPGERLPVVSPMVETNTALKRVAASLDKIVVPLPEIPGWVAQAKGGDKALKYVAVQADMLAKGANAAAAQAQLERVRHQAEMLANYDRLINAMTKSNVEAQAEAARLVALGESKRAEYLRDLYQTLVSIGMGSYKVWGREPGAALKWLDDGRNLLRDVETAFKAYDAHAHRESYPPGYWTSLAKRTTELGIEIDRANAAAIIGSPDLPDKIAVRYKLGATLRYGVLGMSLKTLDAVALERDADMFNTLRGRAALDSKAIQDLRRRALIDYVSERKKYEAMVK